MECAWTREMCEDMKRCGAMIFTNQRPYALGGKKVKMANVAPPGWPDRYVVHTVWSGWLEFKYDRTKLEPLQAKILRDINARWPGHAYIVRHHPDGVLIQDADERILALAQSSAEGLLCMLFNLQVKPEGWIDRQQERIVTCLDALKTRAEERGDTIAGFIYAEHYE